MTREVAIGEQRRRSVHRQLTTMQSVLGAVVAAAIGLALIYWAARDDLWIGRAGLQGLVNSVGSLLFVSVAAASLWGLVGKRAFAREVHAIARTSTDVQQAGIIRVGMNYREDPDWDALFATVRKLDVFVAYGKTWRNLQLDRLRLLAMLPDGRIRLFLPDPDNDPTVERLADRFGYSVDKLRDEIHEAAKFFDELRVAGGARIEIYYSPGHWTFSCYRFDQTAVVTLYTHQQKRVSVPTLVLRDGGSFYDFVRQEFDSIREQSRLATPPDPNEPFGSVPNNQGPTS